MIRALSTSLQRYWFAPAPADRLALLRLATGLFSLWYLLQRYGMLQRTARTDADLFAPVGMVSWLSAPLPPVWFDALLLATIVLNVLYVLGWHFRISGPAFALALLTLFSYRNSWSMIYHNYNALTLHIFILGFVAAADSWSVDSWRQYRLLNFTWTNWRYGWPIKLLCWATAAAYLLSGIAKLAGPLAWEWMDGSAMRAQIAVDGLRKVVYGEELNGWFAWLYPHRWLFQLMGLGTYVLELGAPLVLLSLRLTYSWVVLTWLMHWSIYFLMGIQFFYQMTGLIFLPFLPIERPWRWLVGRLEQAWGSYQQRPKGGAVVLYDGVCAFCDATVLAILARDPRGHFQFATQQSEIGQALLARHLPHHPTLASLVLLENGQAYTASAAALRIALRLRGAWPLLYLLMAMPRSWRDAAYHWVARRRYRWFGQLQACALPPAVWRSRFLELD